MKKPYQSPIVQLESAELEIGVLQFVSTTPLSLKVASLHNLEYDL